MININSCFTCLIFPAKMSKAGCMEKSSYDEIILEEGGCQKNGEETVCVCNTDLCNDGKEESGIEKNVPQFGMIFLFSFSVLYFRL